MQHSLNVNGYDFSYVEAGAGQPLVFLHGSLLDYRYWTREVAHFATDYRAIALSRRHHWPAVPTGEFSYSGLAQVDDMIAFLDALDAGPVHLVGHSYGGYIAAHIACQRPDLLLSASLIEPGGPAEGQAPGRSPAEDFKLGAELIKQGQIRKGVAHFLDSVCLELKWEDGSENYKAMTLSNASTIPQQVAEVRPPIPAEALTKVTCPVLLMLGARSVSPFPETVDRLDALITNVEHVTIPNASHMVNIDNYSAFVTALGRFLKKVP